MQFLNCCFAKSGLMLHGLPLPVGNPVSQNDNSESAFLGHPVERRAKGCKKWVFLGCLCPISDLGDGILPKSYLAVVQGA